jgi:hypothetical protein
VQEQKLLAADGARNAQFGNSVSVNGNVALVGAWDEDNGNGVRTGSAFVFRYNDTPYVQENRSFPGWE